ncbi:MAG TPA: alpha/beta hydrolase [Thermoanaerobaculia bacterium]|nr:alpha/beta hydrolase [Thermoanaerobaculia bacterium]
MADPAQSFIAWTRAELAGAGLERVERDGLVSFRGGSGEETIVLLHGVNDQAGTWCTVVPRLAQFRVIVPDLAGHGESAPQEGPLSMETILAGVDAAVERVDRFTLVGNSMGGWVAMLYTLAHPERVERLILEDASGMAWPLTVPLFPRTREEAVTCLRAVHGPAAELQEWMIDAMLQRAVSAPATRVVQAGVMAHLLDGRLGNLTTPTTLIWGRDDGLLPIPYAETLQKRIAGSTLHVIDGAAHIPHRQQPERFLTCLLETFSASAPA